MGRQSVIERIEILEQKVEALEMLPARVHAVEVQIVHLRDEMRDEFSVLRSELRADFQVGIGAAKRELRAEIRGGDEETRRYRRVLHEEVISRIATLGERPPRRRKPS